MRLARIAHAAARHVRHGRAQRIQVLLDPLCGVLVGGTLRSGRGIRTCVGRRCCCLCRTHTIVHELTPYLQLLLGRRLLLLLLFLLCPWVCTYAEDGAAGACVGWLAYSWAWGPPVAWPCCCSCCACHCACWRTLCKPRTMKFLKVGDAAPSIASMSCPGLAAVKKYRSTSAWCRSAEFSAMRLNMTDSRPRAAGSSATRWQ
mmetsp:Transcript_8458/g.22645  ORF Transcript_8458/g.22645 Transcript_8458/m.22645 type:complete len:202 (+) Transcript_8458:1883-2488(+)